MPNLSKAKFNEIERRIERIFTTDMEVKDFTGDTVPASEDLPDKNRGLIITNCTILFVDIRSSTKLSDKTQAKNMAKIYRAFARGMSMCINESGGRVRQIAGDRVMGVFVDDVTESSVNKGISAAQAILTVVEHLFNPLCRKNVNNKEIGCGIGLDTGRVLTTSIGMKHQGEDSRDLVWTGKTANISSKHTDLAEANEIFVTKRFYDKLSQTFKTDAEGNAIWTKGYRLKGDRLFEGYGVYGFYLDELVGETGEEPGEKRATASTDDLPEAEGIDATRILTDIVQGIESQVGDLLGNFEQVFLREVAVTARETHAEKKLQELQNREEEIKKKEIELQSKEQNIPHIIQTKEREMTYRLKIASLRDRGDNIKPSDFWVELKHIHDLGAKMGKSIGTVHEDVYSWFIVYYLRNHGEYEAAFQELVRQLTDDYPPSYIVSAWNAVPVIKNLGKEREYLNAARYYVKHHNPPIKSILEVRKILAAFGLEKEFGNYSNQLLE